MSAIVRPFPPNAIVQSPPPAVCPYPTSLVSAATSVPFVPLTPSPQGNCSSPNISDRNSDSCKGSSDPAEVFDFPARAFLGLLSNRYCHLLAPVRGRTSLVSHVDARL
ncbi:hypothetical protein Zmor_019186 [Zophobas morio]|uniref:Uncharacterized protein n=1 Tax=Zophobas morio TaxID=2755281 RepID=A0AA38M911_9CUCU|nr:hypothetical protein Zmor_019186 [Zophobas morio]